MSRFLLGLFLFWGGAYFFSFPLLSKVKFEVSLAQSIEENLKNACTLMKKNGLMAKRESMTHFDCMGELVNVRSFCLEMIKFKKLTELKGKYFLRGVVYREKKVLCQFGNSAVLNFSLRDFKYKDHDTKKLCEKLRKHYAFNLKTFHFYKGKNGKRSCYYSKDEKKQSKLLQ